MDLVKARLGWVELYAKTGDAGLVCRRCGISRPTLRKWRRRYQTAGVAGLVDESRRPKRLAAQKVFAEQETLILGLRREGKLGIKQLRNELIRQHDLTLSLDTIHRVLVRHGEQVLKRPRRWIRGEDPLQPPNPRRPRADGRLQDRAGRLPIHGNRRLLTLQGAGRFSSPHRR